MRYLGLDLGSKTLGVAISDKTLTISNALKTIHFDADDYDSVILVLREIIEENDVGKIILGFPKNMNNTLGERALITMDFKDKLESVFNIEVILEDERLTSVISNNILIEADMSRRKRKKVVDALAAQIILQSYLDRRLR